MITAESESGLVYVFTGDGKGKTSASLGVAVRALAAGKKVAVVQWYKDPAWRISEHEIAKLLTPEANRRFAIYPMGKGFHISGQTDGGIKTAPLVNGQVVIDKATADEHILEAMRALEKAMGLIGTVDVLILDEINNAVADQLLSVDDVLQLLKTRGKTHVILTGRDAHPDIIKQADLVTDMKKVKHPYDTGKLAVKGLDF